MCVGSVLLPDMCVGSVLLPDMCVGSVLLPDMCCQCITAKDVCTHVALAMYYCQICVYKCCFGHVLLPEVFASVAYCRRLTCQWCLVFLGFCSDCSDLGAHLGRFPFTDVIVYPCPFS